MSGSIVVVGIGPGAVNQMTPAARVAVESADIIVGYQTYLKLIAALVPNIPREASGMRTEVKRVARVIELAQLGKRVVLVSSGDPGIYGMAGLVIEMLRERQLDQLDVEIVPGLSALNAAASLLGAPLMTDFAVISLSDQLVPREAILRRVELATQADFVLCLYNPKSRHRTDPFDETCAILSRERPPETPVGIVRAAYRDQQQVTLTDLAGLPQAAVDMVTLVIVGNSRTYIHNGKMATARGYGDKYSLDDSREEGE